LPHRTIPEVFAGSCNPLPTSCEAGIPLPYIRDILGHVDLSTTEIYARASTEAKRKALEAAYTEIVTDDLPEWNQNPGLLNWLASL
jgi:hypothetical protein